MHRFPCRTGRRPARAAALAALLALGALLLPAAPGAAAAAHTPGAAHTAASAAPDSCGAAGALQFSLRAVGLDPGPADGIYGPRTAAAVRHLQVGAGLPADGAAGPRTLEALQGRLQMLPHAPYTPPGTGQLEVVVDTRRHRLALLLNGYPVRTYRVGVGTSRTPSPIGRWKVIYKARDWGGGFGTRWIGINVPWGIYGIHGTNKPWLLGRHVSGGCVRMRNQDVEELFDMVPHGTPVIIYGDPVFHRRALVQGHKGTDVLEVQARLKEAGLYSGPLDGIYGPATVAAVRAFQKARGLPVTGIVRWDTYRALGLQG